MNLYKKLVEVIRSQKCLYVPTSKELMTTYGVDDDHMLWGLLEECENFVFAQEESTPFLKDNDSVYPSIDPPFKVFSIENLDGSILATKGDLVEGQGHPQISCIINIEDPYEGIENAGIHWQICLIWHEKKQEYLAVSSNGMRDFVAYYLDRINREEDGVEKTRQKVMLGLGKSKKQHRIRRIIHIRPKTKHGKNIIENSGRRIDFSHRFVRRGHWRDLPGKLGKNRAGDYCVQGRTWVMESRPIGPEDKPIIKKVRVVE